MSNHFAHIYLLDLVFRRYKVLAISGLIALVLSGVFSGEKFITPRFKSNAVLYPVNIIPYGNESATEQMMQLLESDFIKNQMIRKFDLYNHYEIDSTSNSHYYYILQEYDEHIVIKKTEYESVKIEVTDENPKRACDMVNSIIGFMNLKARDLQRNKTYEVFRIIDRQMNGKKKEMDSLSLLVQDMRLKYELIDIGNQSKEVVRGYLRTIDGSNAVNINKEGVEKFKKSIENVGEEFNKVTTYLSVARSQYLDLKNQFENAQKELEKELTYANFVVKPYPADKKSYPVRWVIVVSSLIGTILMALCLLITWEKWGRLFYSNRQPE